MKQCDDIGMRFDCLACFGLIMRLSSVGSQFEMDAAPPNVWAHQGGTIT